MPRQLPFAVLLAAMSATASACMSREVLHEGRARQSALYQLRRIHADLQRVYFDTTWGGLDLPARYGQAEAEIRDAQSDQQRFLAVSRYLRALNDSHTYYLGSAPVTLDDFGFAYRFYGDRPLVTAVNSWMQASRLGLQRGDEILEFAGQSLTRENEYRLAVDFLGRHPIEPLLLRVRSPRGEVKRMEVTADTAAIYKLRGREYRHLYRSMQDSIRQASGHAITAVDERAFVWRFPRFQNVDIGLGRVARRARAAEIVIVDLRGNPGGPIERMAEALAYFIDQPIDIGTLHLRWDEKRFEAKPSRHRMLGKVYLLVDSETASAAEVFTRLLQLHGRATVVGDRTAGAVRASLVYGAASITVSDFVLPNGERLERAGVQPDLLVIATPAQIAAGEDPVMAHVLGLHGIRMSPADAAQVLAR